MINYKSYISLNYILHHAFGLRIANFSFQVFFLLKILKRKVFFLHNFSIVRTIQKRYKLQLFFDSLFDSDGPQSIFLSSLIYLLFKFELINFAGWSSSFSFFLNIQNPHEIISIDIFLVGVELPIKKGHPLGFRQVNSQFFGTFLNPMLKKVYLE